MVECKGFPCSPSNPMSRRIGSCLFVNDNKLYRWRGDLPIHHPQLLDNLEELDLATVEWKTHDVSSTEKDCVEKLPLPITGAACAVVNGRMYLFGGFGSVVLGQQNTYYRNVHELDLATLTWRRLPAYNEEDGPMEKYLCGMVSCGAEMFLVFGGFGVKANCVPLQKSADYHWSHEFGAMWTNEMHLFHVKERCWITPQTSGVKPPPCAAFSFTRIDCHRVLLFAGRQLKERTNEIHILDMAAWHWSGAIMQSNCEELWPTGRSLHTAACLCDPDYVPPPTDQRDVAFKTQSWPQGYQYIPQLPAPVTDTSPAVREQRVLILWGQDSKGEQLSEAWVLHTNSMRWEKLALPEVLEGRKWHSTAVCFPTPHEAMVLTLGGFEKEAQWNSPNHEDTVILSFGVSSLYRLCLQAVCNHHSQLTMDSCLPKHIVADLRACITQERKLNGYQYYKV